MIGYLTKHCCKSIVI